MLHRIMKSAVLPSILFLVSGCAGTAALPEGPSIAGTVADEAGAPVAGARVSAFKDIGTKDGGDFDWLVDLLDREALEKPRAGAATGEDGRFTLSGIEPGDVYAIRVLAPGFRPAEAAFVDAGSQDLRIVLAPGSTLSGRAVTAEGRPAAGAVIEAYAAPGNIADLRTAVSQSVRGPLDATTAAADGSYRFTTLGDGSFVLIATAPGCRDTTCETTLHAGTETMLDIVLAPGSILAGTIEGPGGEPVAGASVTAVPSSPEWEGVQPIQRDRSKRAIADAKGRFSFDTLAPGEHNVTVESPLWAAAVLSNVHVPANDLRISLHKGRTLAGRVTDKNGQPLGGARVVVHDEHRTEKKAVTDDAGRYRIDNVSPAPSTKTVSVEKDGYQRLVSKVRLAAEEPAESAIGEESATVQDFVLDPAGSIAGTLVDAAGKPCGGVRLVLERTATEESVAARILAIARTEADGTFLFPTVPPNVTSRIVVSGARSARWRLEPLTVRPGQHIRDLVIAPSAGISVNGTVAGEAGAPVAGARVEIVRPGERRSSGAHGESFCATGEDGRFALQGLPSGTYQLVVRAQGYREARSAPIECEANSRAAEIDLTLVKANLVAGRVLGSDGEPIPNAAIVVVDSSSGTRKLAGSADDAGAFSIEGLGAEPVEIQAAKEGRAGRILADVPPGTTDIEIVLPRTGAIEGLAVDGAGAPITSYRVRAEPVSVDATYVRPRARWLTVRGAEAQPPGRFQVEGLPPGVYSVIVKAETYREAQIEDITVKAGETSQAGTVTLLPAEKEPD